MTTLLRHYNGIQYRLETSLRNSEQIEEFGVRLLPVLMGNLNNHPNTTVENWNRMDDIMEVFQLGRNCPQSLRVLHLQTKVCIEHSHNYLLISR